MSAEDLRNARTDKDSRPLSPAVWYEVHSASLSERRGEGDIDPKVARRVYAAVARIHRLDAALSTWSKQGRVGVYTPFRGQEAIQVGAVTALRDDDWLVPTFRDLGALLCRGESLSDIALFLMGFEEGTGRHPRNLPIAAPVASQLPHAVGLAWDARLRGKSRAALAFLGDGATSKGDFHEALNFAAVMNLPVVFVCENNGWALSTPVGAQTAVSSLALKSSGYGMRGMQVDGTDVFSVLRAAQEALAHARSGRGPVLLEAIAERSGAHSASDNPELYGKETSEPEFVVELRDTLTSSNIWTQQDEVSLQEEIEIEVSQALEDAQRRGDALRAELRPVFEHVYAEPSQELRHQFRLFTQGTSEPHEPPLARIAAQSGESVELTMVQAINLALREEMQNDPQLILLGQDVAQLGGVFRASAELLDLFGPSRVVDAPLAESAMLGACIGLGLAGRCSVCEIQFAGFIDAGATQLRAHASRFRTRTRGRLTVPMVVRAPFGAAVGAPECHGDSMETFFASMPGLKVVVPSSPRKARALLKAAIRDPDPVVFLEHIALYRGVRELVPSFEEILPLGAALVVQTGRHVTLVSYGAMLQVALEAAEMAAKETIEVEVIDLMSLVPLDFETVQQSVSKTRSLVVVHEGATRGDVGAELATRLMERMDGTFAFERVCAPDIPPPRFPVGTRLFSPPPHES